MALLFGHGWHTTLLAGRQSRYVVQLMPHLTVGLAVQVVAGQQGRQPVLITDTDWIHTGQVGVAVPAQQQHTVATPVHSGL